MARPELLEFNVLSVNRATHKVGALCCSLEVL